MRLLGQGASGPRWLLGRENRFSEARGATAVNKSPLHGRVMGMTTVTTELAYYFGQNRGTVLGGTKQGYIVMS